MAKWLAMWMGSVTAFVVFVLLTQVIFEEFPRPSPVGDDAGVRIAYTNDLLISGIHMSVDTTKEFSRIHFEATSDVENRKENALLILILPYSGIIQDNSGWKWRPFEQSTLFVKEFSCSPNDPCTLSHNNQWFDFKLDHPIDSKETANHSVRLWFFENSPFLDDTVARIIEPFEHTKTYKTGFNELSSAKATVIIDKTTDNRGTDPYAPITRGAEGNFQLDWEIKSGILHQIDYQIPSERTSESKSVEMYTLFGIGLGMLNLVIFGIEKRKKKLKQDEINSRDYDDNKIESLDKIKSLWKNLRN